MIEVKLSEGKGRRMKIITASKAKALAQSSETEDMNIQREFIMTVIKDAAERGKFEIGYENDYLMVLQPKDVKWLESIGYVVDVYENPKFPEMINYLTIKWR